MTEPAAGASGLTLIVRRTIRATPQQLFEAWTEPAHLEKWWGPGPVRCVGVEVDLRPGGRYRIGNETPDGRVLWIAGEFELVDPPHRLVYSWFMEPRSEAPERVTIRFEPKGVETEVIIVHERLSSPESRDSHEAGWIGCLDGLQRFLGGA
jgi:uncharacterized protein YndB with AHSA1/START domain